MTQTPDTTIKKSQEQFPNASPRPWRADTFAIRDANNNPAAHTGGSCRSNDERVDNARLIFTAVNFYDAAYEALKALEAICLKGMNATTDVEWDAAYGTVEAALALVDTPTDEVK